jgi:hypothetical protein
VWVVQHGGTCYWISTYNNGVAGTGKPVVVMTMRKFDGARQHDNHTLKLYRPNMAYCGQVRNLFKLRGFGNSAQAIYQGPSALLRRWASHRHRPYAQLLGYQHRLLISSAKLAR